MPLPVQDIYRDAADRRISWKEALLMTVVIDENGEIHKPITEYEKKQLRIKAHALRPYVTTSNDPYLKGIAKILYS